MKILNILNEGVAELYRALDNTQAMRLVNAVDGKIDFSNAKDEVLATLDELVDLGALDVGYMPTYDGERVAGMIRKNGPRDARRMQRARTAAGIAPVVGDGRYTEVGDRGNPGRLDGEEAELAGFRSGYIGDKARVRRDDSI